jgi:AraC family transcriptional regulator
MTILDLEEDPVAFFPNPRASLEDFCYQNKLPTIESLQWPHCGMDMVLKHLGITVLAAMQRSEPPPILFLDYVGLAVLTHAAHVYGGVRSSFEQSKYLAPWQARRAKEILMANLKGSISVAALAEECGLSTSHFARAFRRPFNNPPHRWLVERRIDEAKRLLLNSRMSLSEIALLCGYPAQPAFNRVMGESPE